MQKSTVTCPGCNEPIEVTGVRQRRTLDKGGTIFHNVECQKAAGRETRPCDAPGCTNQVTRPKSGFTGEISVCSIECRGKLANTSVTYTCGLPGCGKQVVRKAAYKAGTVYCSREHSAEAQRSPWVMVPCALDGAPFQCDARRAARGKPVYCSREHQKLGSRVTLPCSGSSENCEGEVGRYKSQVPKSGRVFCEPCCTAPGSGFKPRTGTNVPCACGCGEQVYKIASEPADREKFVNLDHKARAMVGEERVERVIRECESCGREFRLTPDQHGHGVRTCSRKCTAALRRRKPGERYVDKRTGYAIVTTPDGRVMPEHRWVMEQAIGRRVLSSETVHHLKGGFKGRSNNDISNLELWSGRHQAGHRVEDIVTYCREMLGVYGDKRERAKYAEFAKAVLDDTTTTAPADGLASAPEDALF